MEKFDLNPENIPYHISLYIDLMDNELFFEAHEVMESIWHFFKLHNHPFEKLSKGLTNASISLTHLQRKKKNYKEKTLKTMSSFERHKNSLSSDNILFDDFSTCIKLVENMKKRKYWIFNS